MLKNKSVLSAAAIVSTVCLLLLQYVWWHHSDAIWVGSPAREDLRQKLSRIFPYHVDAELPKYIWQTWKHSPEEEDFESRFRHTEASWTTHNPDFEHRVINDAAAVDLITTLFADAEEVVRAYNALPKPVLKADFFRYLILLARGGIYSDIDTTALKPASIWVPEDFQPFGLVVGIEADPDRPDWQDWYARRIQFCQWTIMGKPGHPILVDIVASITEETLTRLDRDELRNGTMKSIMEFTGPGIWTDSIFDFFNDPDYFPSDPADPRALTWHTFANLALPMKEGDVVVLPITSFSPDVGHMGSKSSGDPLAYVRHGFSGTWKHDDYKGAEPH